MCEADIVLPVGGVADWLWRHTCQSSRRVASSSRAGCQHSLRRSKVVFLLLKNISVFTRRRYYNSSTWIDLIWRAECDNNVKRVNLYLPLSTHQYNLILDSASWTVTTTTTDFCRLLLFALIINLFNQFNIDEKSTDTFESPGTYKLHFSFSCRERTRILIYPIPHAWIHNDEILKCALGWCLEKEKT